MNSPPAYYCLDSSSVIKIFEDYRSFFREILVGLKRLIDAQRLFTVTFVIDEVKQKLDRANRPPHPLSEWLSLNLDQILLPNDDEFLLAGIQVIRGYGEHLVDPNASYIQADCFVIGAANLWNLTVVSDERTRFNRRLKSQSVLHIPDVCDALNIRCITLAQLLAAENII